MPTLLEVREMELEVWFDNLKEEIEESYLGSNDDLKGSGWGGSLDRWRLAREVILKPVSGDGTFLDLGCANGYLLQSLCGWSREKGRVIEPFGVDISSRLVERARERFPQYRHHFSVGNALTWRSDRTFDYVRTELDYVPPSLVESYISRLFKEVVAPGGTLIVASYGSRSRQLSPKVVQEVLLNIGFDGVKSSFALDTDGSVMTRIAWVVKAHG